MYLKSIRYQREEYGTIYRGWYIGKTDISVYCEDSCFLDENFQPIPKDLEVDGRMVSVLRVHKELKDPIIIYIPTETAY